MAARYGAENVYDFSLGNPATPAPEKIKTAIYDILDKEDPLVVHGYMANAGYEEVRDQYIPCPRSGLQKQRPRWLQSIIISKNSLSAVS